MQHGIFSAMLNDEKVVNLATIVVTNQLLSYKYHGIKIV